MRKNIALTLTYLFQPLLIPAYGLGLLGVSSFFYPHHPLLKVVVLSLSFLLAVVLPVLWYALLRKLKVITTSQASAREERKWAYLFTLSAYAVVAALSYYFGIKWYYVYLWLGAYIALLVVYIVNHFWKISAHATGMGGFLAAVIFFSIFSYKILLVPIIVVSLCSGSVMWSRLELKAHSPAQLVAGFAVGFFSMMFLPFITFL
jgi:hypothetical protein